MLVDDYEKYTSDRQDVTEIRTDGTPEDTEREVLADDCMCIFFHSHTNRRPFQAALTRPSYFDVDADISKLQSKL